MSKQEKHLPKIDKNPMQQITNHSKNKLNKLAGRLYRNSSLSHINSNISMLSVPKNQLDPSFLNFSSNMSSNQLVASISLKKMKKKMDSQPYMQISNGKLLVNRNKSEFNESSFQETLSNNKKMFKKLQKLSYSPTNRILPDELIDFTIEKEHNEAKIFKKSSLSPKAKNKKIINDKEDLLPEDFIQLLEQQKKITNQFCYLKKMEHPYDLKIVQFEKNLQRKSQDSPVQYPSQYITISSRGITYFSQDQSRFVTLQQWKKQANYFKKIIKLDFFKNFKVIKNFSNWKKYLRKSAMKSTIQKLKQKLFYNDKYLRSSLLRIRDICYIMETDVSYCRLDDCQKVANFRQFKTEQQAFIQNEFERRIFQLEENIKEVLMNNMAESMKEFKEQNKISSSIQGKGMPLLIGDQKNLQMPYTKQATLRTQQQKFQKFIKLIDILITHSKVNMMSESTSLLIRKIDEENDNYQKQTYFESKQKGRQKENLESQLMDKSNFKGKQYLQCVLTLDLIESGLLLRPTKEDLISLFEDIVNRSVVRLCRNHKKISSDIDVLSIIYDSPQQFPKESQSQNLKAIMTSDGRQQEMLRSIMKSILISYEYIAKYVERFQKIAIDNHKNVRKIQEIEEQKSNQSLKNVEDKLNQQSSGYEKIIILIQQLQKHKEQISKIKKEHDGPIFEVNLKQFKQKTEKRTNLCISKAKQIVPKMFENSMNKLNNSLMKALQNLEEQPTGVESMINFNNHKNQVSENVPIYEDQMRQITCLQILMRNILCSSSEVNSLKKYDGQTKKLQSALNSVRNKITDSQKNNKIYQSRAQKQVKEMVPKNRSKISELYNKIQLRCREQKTAEQMMTFIHKKNAELKLIFKEFNDIITYQKYLNLEQSDPNQIQSFETFFGVFEKIWSTTYEYEKYSTQLEEKTCGLIKASEVYSKLEQFINVMVGLQKELDLNKQKDVQYQFSNHDYSAVNNVLERVQTLKPIIETIECLNDPVLGDKEWKQIKSILQQKNIALFRVLQIDKNERKTKEYIKTSASSELKFFQSVVVKAKKSQQISQKFQSIKNFTNFSKQHLGLFRNLTEKFRTYIGQILEEVDNKIMMVNYILEETESNEHERAKSEKNTLQKLKEILLLWDQYEQHVQYFQPIYNLTDWKSTPQAKLFISATDQNWKKIYKSNKDSNLSKILMNERIIPSLKESNEMLESIYPSLNEYFNSKRLQCMRLYFLSNDEIVNIHSQNKDFKSLNMNINKIFPTIKQLLFRGEELNPCQIVNMDGQVLQLKAGRVANYDVEQMVKFIDDGIKIGVKSILKACNTAYENQKFDKMAWIKEFPLQTLVFISNVYFSTIIEQDYLSSTAEQIEKDLEKYENYHLSQIEGYRDMIAEASNNLLKKKLYVLLTQALNIRDVISNLIHENVKTKDEYQWLKHIRCSYRQDQASIEYFNYHVSYGNEFVCMIDNPLIQIFSNQKTLLKLINCMMDCNSIPLVTSSLLPQLSIFNAKSYHRLSLSTGNEINILKSYIQGTWLAGSFTDICLPINLSDEQLIIIAKTVQQIQTNLKETNFLRGFKNMPINREAGISLISSTLASFSSLKQCNFDNRIITTHELPWGVYMELLFNIYGINLPNFSKKLQFAFSYLQTTIQDFKISRQSVKDWVIEASFMIPHNQTEIARLFLNYIKKKDFKNHERKFIFKMFMQVFSITHVNQIQSHKSIRQSSSCEQEINKLISILKQNKVCILMGKNSQFKDFIAHQIQREFCEKNAKFNYFIVNQQNLNQLLGQYINGKWVYGLLSTKIRECKNSDCIVLLGKISQTLIWILQILNSDDQNKNYINLENGERIFLNKNQKVILMSEEQANNNNLKNCNLKVFDLGGVKFSPEEVLSYITQQKKSTLDQLTIQNKHFKSNPESLSSLMNLYLNNLEKINNSNLKMIGYKSDFIETCLIMNRFSVLISVTLANDKQKCCIQNLKMMEKLYVWCLYWSIGSCLPKMNMGRLDKLFDSIKIEYDKSYSLRQSKFSISQRNMTISKFIKDEKIFSNRLKDYFIVSSELQAKTNLIKLLRTQNNHIMLIGERNSGKSNYMEYLENVLENDGCSIVKAKITKQTTLTEFLTWIKPKIYTQYFPNKTDKKYKLCPVSGKKLIVLVDNFNFINRKSSLMQFFHSTTTFGYYYDFNTNSQVYLGDICFICAKNGNFQVVNNEYTFLLRNFFPIYINSPELPQIMEVYSQDLQKLEHDKKELLKKILSSISSLHIFAVNLLNSQKCKRIINLTFYPPIWIAKEIIRRCKDENCSHNDVISLWKYLTVKKYIESGLLYEFADEILHEISNLISLIVKSSTQSQFFLRNQTKFIHMLEQTNPLLSINYNYSEYYIFFSYLIRSSQLKHLISHSCVTPKTLKKKIISEICAQYQINFSYLDQVENLKQIRNKKNMIIYVDGSNQILVEKVLAVITEQNLNPHLGFIIDAQTKQQLTYYTRFYPTIEYLAHIYDVPPIICQKQQQIDNYATISSILIKSGINKRSRKFQEMFWQFTKMNERLWPKLKQNIVRRLVKLKSVLDNLSMIQQTIQQSKSELATLTEQIGVLTEKQKILLSEKNKKVELLSKLKNKQNLSDQSLLQKETLNKGIYGLDVEIKKIKSEMNEKIESISKIKDSSKEKIQVFVLLQSKKNLFTNHYQICQKIVENQQFSSIMALLHSAVFYYFENPKQSNSLNLYNSALLISTEKLGNQLSHIYSVILGVNISSISEDQCVIRWIFSSYESFIVTNKVQLVIQKLQNACPEAKLCLNQYQFNQNVGIRPIISKQINQWGEPKVTVVTSEQNTQKNKIQITFGENECDKQLIKKIEEKLMNRNNENYLAELAFSTNEKRRLENEDGMLEIRLIDKLKLDKNIFGANNSISQVKQIMEAKVALSHRINANEQKIKGIVNQIQSKYKRITTKFTHILSYVKTVKQLYPYFNYKDNHLVSVMETSFVFQQEQVIKEDRGENKEEAGQVAKQYVTKFRIEQTQYRMELNTFKWIYFNLSPSDSVVVYFLQACFKLKEKKILSQRELTYVLTTLKSAATNNNSVNIISNESLKQVMDGLIANAENKYYLMLQFAQKQLHFGFKSAISLRQQWITTVSKFFEPNSNPKQNSRKFYLLIAPLQDNCYRLIQKQIRRHISSEQSILYLSDQQSVEHRIQCLQKLAVSQQGWIILRNWKNKDKINKIKTYIEESKIYKVAFVVQDTVELEKIKAELNPTDLYQLYLSNKNNRIFSKLSRIIKKHYIQNCPQELVQANRLLKVIAQDQVSQFIKDLTEEKYNFSPLSYSLIEQVLKKISNPTVKDLVQFASDNFQSSADGRNKSIFKQIKISQSSYENLIESLKNKSLTEDNLKQVLKHFIPENIVNKIRTDSILGYNQYSKTSQIIPDSNSIFQQKQTIAKAEMILQKAPILCKQEQEKVSSLHMQIMKREKKELQKIYSAKLEKVKRLNKVLESKRYLTIDTEKELISLTEEADKILKDLLEIYAKIILLQKNIESRQKIIINQCIELLSQPVQFIRAYLFQTINLSRVNWANSTLQMRCITEKEKENLKQQIQKNEYIQFSGLKINNGKFDSHKGYIQSFSAGESSKLTNVYIYFGRDQPLQLSKSVPFVVNDINVAEISFMTKAKQPGIWSAQVTVTLKNESEKENMKKK